MYGATIWIYLYKKYKKNDKCLWKPKSKLSVIFLACITHNTLPLTLRTLLNPLRTWTLVLTLVTLQMPLPFALTHPVSGLVSSYPRDRDSPSSGKT